MPSSGPQNLRVSEEWYNRLRITWDPPSALVKGYRIVYKPVSGKFLSEPRVDISSIFKVLFKITFQIVCAHVHVCVCVFFSVPEHASGF